ncbi:MAG: nuclear transport factor 2 family protein [Acidimicrobiales bacterium]
MSHPPTDDVVAIEQVLYRYAHILDRGTIDEALDLFAAEATLITEMGGGRTHHEGRAAVREWLQTYHFDRAGRIRNMRHKVSTPLIEGDSTRATAVSYLDADGVDTGSGRGRVTVGRYEDLFERSGHRWLISERQIMIADRHYFADE